jgi:hypothetical protein
VIESLHALEAATEKLRARLRLGSKAKGPCREDILDLDRCLERARRDAEAIWSQMRALEEDSRLMATILCSEITETRPSRRIGWKRYQATKAKRECHKDCRHA